MMKTEYTEVKSGDSVPSYFRCSLSLELMLDPVIAASGQTFERLVRNLFIQILFLIILSKL
ncbi:putative U box domain-containing protein [Lupinus albus]|uniref:Putative U box domain-containing protein n=1 Tax=Lupinus albus TaxID=3870 RepID=A0A6A4R1U0_LUPAL|nr:putative U box domain-containing protein [Lupinus albus]